MTPGVKLSFEKALFGLERPWFLGEEATTAASAPPVKEEESHVTAESKADERTRALEGLVDLAVKTMGETGEDEFRFKGGSLKLKGPQTHRHWVTEVAQAASRDELETWLGIDSEDRPGGIMFLGETQEERQRELLTKMIAAMKLGDRPIYRLPMPDDEGLHEDWKRQVARHISFLRPRLLVSLGALTTNLIFAQKERLSHIHGTFFRLELNYSCGGEQAVEMIPIFHPEFLLINPKMKEATWTDLKKIMGILQENP